jgi:hypothetical protein
MDSGEADVCCVFHLSQLSLLHGGTLASAQPKPVRVPLKVSGNTFILLPIIIRLRGEIALQAIFHRGVEIQEATSEVVNLQTPMVRGNRPAFGVSLAFKNSAWCGLAFRVRVDDKLPGVTSRCQEDQWKESRWSHLERGRCKRETSAA